MKKVVANMEIGLITSSLDFTEKDYNNDEDLVQTYKFTMEDIKPVFKEIWKRIHNVAGKNSKIYPSFKKISVLSTPKTMIACHSIQQADFLYDLFRTKLNEKQVVKSYSKTTTGNDPDVDSSNVKLFSEDPECKILLVIKRGILGYDCPDIEYIIDFTATRNVDRIMQLMGRGMRLHSRNKKKIYLKVIPRNLQLYSEAQLATCVALFHKENNEKWTGNYKEAPIIINKKKAKALQKLLNRETSKTIKSKRSIKIDTFLLDFEEYRKAFEDLTHKDNDIFSQVNVTTLKKVRAFQLDLQIHDSKGNKQKIYAFVHLNKRLPSKYSSDKEEKRLYVLHNNYTSKSSESYDPEYEREIRKLDKKYGLHLQIHDSKGNKQKIYNFIHLNKRLPSQSSSDKEEKRLWKLHSNYTSKSHHSYDPEYEKEIIKLYKKYNFKKLDTSPIVCINNNTIYKNKSIASKKLSVFTGSISDVIKKKYSHTKGYKFRKANKKEIEILGEKDFIKI